MSAPTIRIAGAADLPAIHALIECAYRGDSARAGWTHESDLLSEDRTSLDELAAQWQVERRFHPTLPREQAAERMARWEHAVRQTMAS